MIITCQIELNIRMCINIVVERDLPCICSIEAWPDWVEHLVASLHLVRLFGVRPWYCMMYTLIRFDLLIHWYCMMSPNIDPLVSEHWYVLLWQCQAPYHQLGVSECQHGVSDVYVSMHAYVLSRHGQIESNNLWTCFALSGFWITPAVLYDIHIDTFWPVDMLVLYDVHQY